MVLPARGPLVWRVVRVSEIVTEEVQGCCWLELFTAFVSVFMWSIEVGGSAREVR